MCQYFNLSTRIVQLLLTTQLVIVYKNTKLIYFRKESAVTALTI